MYGPAALMVKAAGGAVNSNAVADALAANAATAVASTPWVKAAGGGTLVVASIDASSAAGPLGAGGGMFGLFPIAARNFLCLLVLGVGVAVVVAAAAAAAAAAAFVEGRGCGGRKSHLLEASSTGRGKFGPMP